MRTALVLAACLWPVTLAAALVDQLDGRSSTASAVVYVAASRVCHQQPARSLATAGHQWPVCGRCAGLYLAAPFGALAARLWRRRSAMVRTRRVLLAAALPTAVTVAAEWMAPASITSLVRLIAALPLGGTIAWLLVNAMPGPREAIR